MSVAISNTICYLFVTVVRSGEEPGFDDTCDHRPARGTHRLSGLHSTSAWTGIVDNEVFPIYLHFEHVRDRQQWHVGKALVPNVTSLRSMQCAVCFALIC